MVYYEVECQGDGNLNQGGRDGIQGKEERQETQAAEGKTRKEIGKQNNE